MNTRMGISGRLAAAFANNPLTPILALTGLLLGLVAVSITPREEEPQIDVTMANVMVPFPGASAEDVEHWVATPLEQSLSEVEGVKHVYSTSRPGMALVTVEYQVGVARQAAIVRTWNQVLSRADRMPAGLGIGQPLVRPMGIDDVPVMALTLWSDDPGSDSDDLARIAHSLESELKRIPDTRDIYTIGSPARAVTVTLDSSRLSGYGLVATDVAAALKAANLVREPGERIGADRVRQFSVGTYLADAEEIADLTIGLQSGAPVFLRDVADIRAGADLPAQIVWHGAPRGSSERPQAGIAPAVTLAIAKKPGTNAADITAAVTSRLDALRASLLPAGVHVVVSRDYGFTASDKAATLIKKLIFATTAVVLLVWFALGRREAVVVGVAVLLTLAVTLFASWAMGFTINRVSLFALIFAIGILVDDAIVVVENIHRHMREVGADLRTAIPPAVDEVGGPTILATFTVIAALLPMAFVSGLMGPYMRPIPINASVGMLLSLLVALSVTPWLAGRLLRRQAHADPSARLGHWFERLLRPFLRAEGGERRRRRLWLATALALAAAVMMVGLQWVVLKMLPFDNKSEFQVVVDLPEGTALERSNALLLDLAQALDEVPEVRDYQAYAGTAAPINFNGLVRQYYLRSGPNLGDLQVNLIDRHARSRQSHEIARSVRPGLASIGAAYGASVKVVEVPPGPPVLAPLVAELYGPDYERLRALGRELAPRFAAGADIVDVDSSVEAASAEREQVVVDRTRAARLGVDQARIAETLALAVGGLDATWLHDGQSKYAPPVWLRLPAGDQASIDQLLALKVRADDGRLVPLSELVRVVRGRWQGAIQHKDLLPVVYVTADAAGDLDSPLYGMFRLAGSLRQNPPAGGALDQHYLGQPEQVDRVALKWDGEWQITFETFRDMGLAYAAGIVLIYLLVVAQFRSYVVPLIVMAPIPLTAIGVLPGHALLGAQFTATSMIGMIALAGIIVRNSILLVDFANHAITRGRSPADAVIEACTVRAQPIALTALAAMLGALFILDDPIFNGLAISLIFGIAVSTVLTLIVIPLLYFVHRQHRPVG